MNLAFFNAIIKRYLLKRYQRIEKIRNSPHVLQENLFKNLIHHGSSTKYFKKFQQPHSMSEFRRNIPIVDYAQLKTYIHRMMLGEENVLWPGNVKYFAKSSGTTHEKSKFIPVSKEKLYQSHIGSNWDLMSTLYFQRPDSTIFADKNLVMGGSLSTFKQHPETIYGDVSAIMIHRMPTVGRPFYTPDFKSALLPDWEEKLEIMSQQCIHENVVMIGGVPTWTVVLLRKILEATGKDHILEVWPNLKTYIHGGVGFDPYREQFLEFIPSSTFDYLEVYNASEGFFAIQDILGLDELLLMLDNGVYYEFLPAEEWNAENPQSISLKDVQIGKNYALVISTSSGLWRYMPGDTICFTSIKPYRIKVTGRTQHFINAFGEEVMISNTDLAISQTCEAFSCIVSEYTVAPIYFEKNQKAGHQWVIEFEKPPVDTLQFATILDQNLQKINSDYEAKRFKNIALNSLQITCVPSGSFINWMKYKGKVGGQHKVPRLSNDRKNIDDLLNFVALSKSYAEK